MTDVLSARLNQRGRAMVDFMALMLAGSGDVRAAVNEETAKRVPDPEELPDDLDERNDYMQKTLSQTPAYRVQKLLGEWHGKNHGVVAMDAFDEVRQRTEPLLKKFDEGPATIEADPSFKPPGYWDGVNFHRTAGGWDGHEYQGYVHGEIVHRKMVDKLFPGGIFKQRRMIAEMAPKDSYRRILDMGCSTGHFTQALAETYPDADIYGVDLSLKTLEQARRVANAQGWAWKLYQRPAEDTGFDDGHFDLVASYILLHEMPASAIRGVFEEAFRVLEPGGDLIMSDVNRYADMDKLAVWQADSGALYGGEPHWRESASLDLGALAREVGFVDVIAEGKSPGGYPYVVQGTKPV